MNGDGYKMQRLRLHHCAAATSTDTMNVNGGRSVTYRNGGEGGIRTHGRISPTHAFQACSLNRSDTSPCFVAKDFINLAETACRRTALAAWLDLPIPCLIFPAHAACTLALLCYTSCSHSPIA